MKKESETTKEEVIEGIPYDYCKKRNGGGSTFGIVVVFLGILFLLNNLNILPWSVWNQIVRLWPLLIIVLGLKMFLGKSAIGRAVSLLITLFILAGVIFYILYSYQLLNTLGIFIR